MINDIKRNEYPRPSFERKTWLNLNGEWDFEYDDNNLGLKNKWYENKDFSKKIIVPYVFQTELSGINEQEVHDIIWYSKDFDITEDLKDKRVMLHFGAVDYKADIWVNGIHLMNHEGGHVPFSVEITDVLKEKGNNIKVRVEDYTYDLEIPRGKQYWKEKSDGIFYTRTTGIWQTVWLEAVGESYLKSTFITPDLDNKKVLVEYELDGFSDNTYLEVEISLHDIEIVKDKIRIINGRGKREFWLDQNITVDWNHQESWAWSPENPVLFYVTFKVINNDSYVDEVKSYFGLRKVSIVSGKFMLNNRPYFQKLLLDQGYWEKSLLTAPTDEDFIKDIELSKAMGFNGVRKHQKIEDPRYLYWADKLGFIVWGEIASAYNYSRNYAARITKEWMEMIYRDYNHPCIVAWTPLNESWGVDCIMNNKNEQAHSASMYWLTKSLDQTRPVISNDGWDHTKSDLFTIHDYEWRKEVLEKRYSSLDNILNSMPSGRTLMAQGWEYEGQPIIVSEMGGISYKKSDWEGWGYSSASSDEDYAKRYYDVISPLLESPFVQGFVYTQITDVEQEINGLLTYGREPKIESEIIKAINEGKWKPN
ncbi:MAG TPA: glycoside hydrolase family 2 TIM barrel-domain containing protein [Clostridium sp.]